jgi:hypothetical protein
MIIRNSYNMPGASKIGHPCVAGMAEYQKESKIPVSSIAITDMV